VNLSHFVRIYDADLDAAMCARLIELFNSVPQYQQANGGATRPGLEQSKWTELNVSRHADAGFLGFFRRHIDAGLARYNADIGLAPIAVPNSPHTADLILKRYRPDGTERFQVHFDAINEMADRYLVFLWYLNDVAAGGATQFPQLQLSVAPRAGRLLIFPPYWMFQHGGLPPESGDKYILSTYLLFPGRQAR
jgi:prolyl 4-hydroxylase